MRMMRKQPLDSNFNEQINQRDPKSNAFYEKNEKNEKTNKTRFVSQLHSSAQQSQSLFKPDFDADDNDD